MFVLQISVRKWFSNSKINQMMMIMTMIIYAHNMAVRPPTCNNERVCNACVHSPNFSHWKFRALHLALLECECQIWSKKIPCQCILRLIRNCCCYTPVQLNFHARSVCLFSANARISTIIYPFARFLECSLCTEFDRMAEFTECVCARVFSSRCPCTVQVVVRVALLCITLKYIFT